MRVLFKDAAGNRPHRVVVWRSRGFIPLDEGNPQLQPGDLLLIHANDLLGQFPRIADATASQALQRFESGLRNAQNHISILYFSGGGDALRILSPFGAKEGGCGVHFYEPGIDNAESYFADRVRDLAAAWHPGNSEPDWKLLNCWREEARVFAGEQILADAAGLSSGARNPHPFDEAGLRRAESQPMLGCMADAAREVQQAFNVAVSAPDARVGLVEACRKFLQVEKA